MNSQGDDTNWAVSEFADADLGDLRRTKRLVELARRSGPAPHRRLARACGDGALRKAAYRFLANDAIAPKTALPALRGDRQPREPGPHGVGGARYHRSRLDQPPGDPGLGAPGPYGLSGSACPSYAGVHA